MIINLRGPNGSGKSTVAFKLIALGAESPIQLARYETPKGAERFVEGYYIPSLDLIVVGAYRTACGGCDGIKTQDLVKSSAHIARGMARHVFFEGVIVSTLFGGYYELSKGLREEFGEGLTWAYLDTPRAVCLERIQKRNGGVSILEYRVDEKIKCCDSTRARALAAGEDVRDVNYKHAVKQILGMLK